MVRSRTLWTEQFTKARLKKFNLKMKVSKLFNTVKENKLGQTVHHMKDIGSMGYNKEKVFKFGQKVTSCTPVNGSKDLRTATAHKLGTTVHPTKDNGSMITCKDKVPTIGPMAEFTTVTG